ncbi:MAG: endonuclease V [Myxococcales bacterium]|nr:endonuclease V [Myxococcales bacterium]MCB9716667.1 endonuclease V [Myxococcales bacterium]
MLACVDVDYREGSPAAVAAALVFADWGAAEPVAEHVEPVEAIEPYVPGQLYRRELPCLLAVLGRVSAPLGVILVDGYVVLDAEGRPGLGAHLYEALGRRVAVVGVAKSVFEGSAAIELRRGESVRPLYVSAVGMDAQEAADGVLRMHGPHRLPTLLKRVDRLCRDA